MGWDGVVTGRVWERGWQLQWVGVMRQKGGMGIGKDVVEALIAMRQVELTAHV